MVVVISLFKIFIFMRGMYFCKYDNIDIKTKRYIDFLWNWGGWDITTNQKRDTYPQKGEQRKG